MAERGAQTPFGDFDTIFDRYAELSGEPVDLAAIQYHHLFFTLAPQLSLHRPLARPHPATDYMTYAYWVSETNLCAVETLADYLGIALEDVAYPAPVSTPASGPHRHLSSSLESLEVADPSVADEVRIACRLARHLNRFDEIGEEVLGDDRADLAALIGRAPASWNNCEAALERFILDDGGRHDAELVVLFNRRWRRYKALMGPVGSPIAAHRPMARLGRSLLP